MKTETLAAGGVLALTTAIATDLIRLPYAAFASPIAIFIMVVASLGAFRLYPALGLTLFLLTAVLFFKRNAATLYSARSTYGDVSIAAEAAATAVPYASEKSGPRRYDQFNETDASNAMLGPVREGFVGASAIADVPAGLSADAGAPVEGEFPIDAPRPHAAPVAQPTGTYRPATDMGDNTFTRFGPDMDQKKRAFAY